MEGYHIWEQNTVSYPPPPQILSIFTIWQLKFSLNVLIGSTYRVITWDVIFLLVCALYWYIAVLTCYDVMFWGCQTHFGTQELPYPNLKHWRYKGEQNLLIGLFSTCCRPSSILVPMSDPVQGFHPHIPRIPTLRAAVGRADRLGVYTGYTHTAYACP